MFPSPEVFLFYKKHDFHASMQHGIVDLKNLQATLTGF